MQDSRIAQLNKLLRLLFKSHPWHGMPPGDCMPDVLNAYIEIVPNDTVKYEIDKSSGHLKDATQIDKLARLNRNMVNRYLRGILTRIAAYCEDRAPFIGEIEVDESYFGERPLKGKRVRGAYGKPAVFGVCKRNGCVYTEIVPTARKPPCKALSEGKWPLIAWSTPTVVAATTAWWMSAKSNHLRIDHSKDQCGQGRTHINGSERLLGTAQIASDTLSR